MDLCQKIVKRVIICNGNPVHCKLLLLLIYADREPGETIVVVVFPSSGEVSFQCINCLGIKRAVVDLRLMQLIFIEANGL